MQALRVGCTIILFGNFPCLMPAYLPDHTFYFYCDRLWFAALKSIRKLRVNMQISIRIPKQNDAARSCYSNPGYSIFVISNLQNTLNNTWIKKEERFLNILTRILVCVNIKAAPQSCCKCSSGFHSFQLISLNVSNLIQWFLNTCLIAILQVPKHSYHQDKYFCS